MRFGRFRSSGVVGYGAVQDDVVRWLEHAPYAAEGVVFSTRAETALDEVEVLVPIEPRKIVCVGRNFADHAQQMALPTGAVPSVFFKADTTLLAHGGSVELPPASVSSHVEHEAELAVVIAKQTRWIRREEAGRHIFGYTAADDVSARDLQKSDPQLTRAKGFDTFCPLGPFIDTDLDLDASTPITCLVNGSKRQHATTANMLFDIATLIEHLSSWMTLLPGDVILTGSPGGTGPLVAGDTVEITVGALPPLQHSVSANSRE